jgi:branched-chain amino acid transport system substrate-binding protein
VPPPSVSRRSAAFVACLAACLLAAGCGTRLVGRPAPSQATRPAPAAPATEMPQVITPGQTPPGPEQPGAEGPAGRRRAALLVPLSGPSGPIGRAILDAAQLALFDIAEENFELAPRDTRGTAEGAAAAARAALQGGVQIILGPLLAAEVEAVQPLARAAGVPLVAFSTESRLAGNGTYLMSFLPKQQVERVTRFAKEKGAARLAALAPSTPYGQLVVDAYRDAAQAAGATVTRVEMYDPAAPDLTPVVRRLASFDQRKAALTRERAQLEAASDDASKQALRRLQGRETAGDAEFDALLLPEGGSRLKAIAPLLPYYDIDPGKVRLLGTGVWDEPGLGLEPALIGGWFAAPPHEARADFETRFQAAYKRRPPRLATLGYDAAALAALLARDDRGGSFAAAAITNPSGFAGVDGIFRFLPDGTVQRGLAVLEVQRNGARIVDPAPESFQDLGY